MQKFESDPQLLLKTLCDSKELADVIHPYAFIQGLIFTVAAAPEIPMPEKWLPWAIKTNNQLTSIEQADQLTDVLMKALQQQLKNMSEEKIQLPSGITLVTTDCVWIASALARIVLRSVSMRFLGGAGNAG